MAPVYLGVGWHGKRPTDGAAIHVGAPCGSKERPPESFAGVCCELKRDDRIAGGCAVEDDPHDAVADVIHRNVIRDIDRLTGIDGASHPLTLPPYSLQSWQSSP